MNGDQLNGPRESVRPAAIDQQSVREEAERVLADPLFRYSQRSSNLLKYIVDRSLEGKSGDLKERIIGIEVFGRTPDYDTSNDSTVRVVANEVRKRLAQYYAKAGHEQELRIDIPVRSYVAEFKLPSQVAVNLEPVPKQEVFPKRYIWASAVAVIVALGIWVGMRLLFPVPAIDRFWAPIVNGSGTVMICVGSPYNPIDDSNGIPAEGLPPKAAGQEIPFYSAEQRVYVRMLDANAAEQVSDFLRRKRKDSIIRPTQGNQLADLRSQPIILYGMFLNEWADRAGAGLHFKFRKNSESGHGLRWIEDASKPEDRNWTVDLAAPYERIDNDYALLTRVRDPATGKWWIGIAGLTGIGTLAANQIALDDKAMATIDASLPKGWEAKNLQIVLEIKVVQGSPGTTRVVTTYSW